jgi:hypothetical protein
MQALPATSGLERKALALGYNFVFISAHFPLLLRRPEWPKRTCDQ